MVYNTFNSFKGIENMNQVITNPKALGQIIKRYRNLKKLSQQALSNRANLGQKSISFVEQGKSGVRIDTIFRLLNELDLEIIVQPKPESSQEEW